MCNNSEQNITNHAITLMDMQTRLFQWQTRMENYFDTDYESIPNSIFIPYPDLQAIVNGFTRLEDGGYTIAGARLYLTFSSLDEFHIEGVLVPVGALNNSGLAPEDIVIDVNNPGGDIGPDTTISAYDFTLPCPPMGHCDGCSPLFKEQGA